MVQRTLVSIIIPTYNRPDLLKQCLGSLFLLDYPRYEIIVIDDGSSISLKEEYGQLHNPNIHWITQPHQGVSVARNRGVAAAQGEIIAFIDDDCLAQPSWIRYLVEPFHDGRVYGVSGRVIYVREGHIPEPFERPIENPKALWPMGCNIAYRKSVLTEVGGFDPGLTAYEDKDVAIKIWERGHIVPEPKAKVFHQKNMFTPERMRESIPRASTWVLLHSRYGMNRLRMDKNNPPPILFGRVVLPRSYAALLKRLVYLPWYALVWLFGSKEKKIWARHEWQSLRFLIHERRAIWHAAKQSGARLI